jgi:hypothetical protein
MDITAWLLVGILVGLIGILLALLAWLRFWKAFLREYRQGQETTKRLLLGNFSDLLEALRTRSIALKSEGSHSEQDQSQEGRLV